VDRLEYPPFAPRVAAFQGIVERAGHRLKGYSVRYGDRPLDWDEHREGIDLALAALPQARPEQGGESFCVWDLEIVGRERDAYVETVLADGDAEAYLARRATDS
jgi:hypothetical protein